MKELRKLRMKFINRRMPSTCPKCAAPSWFLTTKIATLEFVTELKIQNYKSSEKRPRYIWKQTCLPITSGRTCMLPISRSTKLRWLSWHSFPWCSLLVTKLSFRCNNRLQIWTFTRKWNVTFITIVWLIKLIWWNKLRKKPMMSWDQLRFIVTLTRF